MENKNSSVVIVGSGISGLYCALKLAETCPNVYDISLITKSTLKQCNSHYAQGGIVGVLSENTADSVESHISDTIRAGAGLCDFDTVKFISEKSEEVIKDVMTHGVNFDRKEDGSLNFTLEGAHSVKRILHAGGDATGSVMEDVLVDDVLKNSKIKIFEHTMAVDLLVNDDKRCVGLVAYNEKDDRYLRFNTSHVILATGGMGRLYPYTTNPSVATGDGVALAYREGAVIQDIEFIQFHPTALALELPECNFLISEAVRGEGAKLCHADGTEFMHKYHELKDLAPRDIVARAIYNEMTENNLDNVYLNATVIDKEVLAKRFPTISRICGQNGIDISKDFIPVFPVAHYSMGGVKTNVEGKTSIKGLYALGETASTGLHGANRLASNSLLECLVIPYQLCEYIKNSETFIPDSKEYPFENIISKYSKELGFAQYDAQKMTKELKNIMWENVSILRNEESLLKAQKALDDLKGAFLRDKKCLNIEEYSFRNLLLNAELVIKSALARKESRGAHYRTDYLNQNDVAEHSVLLNEQGELVFVK